MTRPKISKGQQKPQSQIGLVFGEDNNDAEALIELTKALWSAAPPLYHVRSPLILVKGRKDAEARKNGEKVAGAVKAFGIRKKSRVAFVIAHQDCDAVEPAHVQVADRIKDYLQAGGIEKVVPVAPAWEMEAWWFLWPTAVAAINRKWKKIKASNANHGMVQNAKETLRKTLRDNTTRDYEESDAPKIAAKIRELGIISEQKGKASSFTAFESAIYELKDD